MRTIIPTSALGNRVKCIPLIERLGLKAEFVCATYEEHLRFLAYFGKEYPIHVADLPDIDLSLERIKRIDTIAAMRSWINTQLVDKGEWYMFMDDNVYDVTALPMPFYDLERIDFDDYPNQMFREIYDTPVSREFWELIVEDVITEAESRETIHIGFATESNHFFRKLKWQRWGYCRTQIVFYKSQGADDLWYRPNELRDMLISDFVKSVETVVSHGSVVINRFVKPMKKFFESGGLGTLEDRMPYLINTCQHLMRKYPGLLNYVKDRPYQLTFAKRSQRTINEWREKCS